MTILEHLALDFYENNIQNVKELILKAYKEGYEQGIMKSHEISIEGIKFYNLGLPSGTLWSEPIHKSPAGCYYFNYITYSYDKVVDLSIPTLEEFQELLNQCQFAFNSTSCTKEVCIIGPSGARIRIDTENFDNRPGVPGTHICRRRGEGLADGTNMFWLKSDIIDNRAKVGVVDINNKTLYPSTHFTGYELPYLLVKRVR